VQIIQPIRDQLFSAKASTFLLNICWVSYYLVTWINTFCYIEACWLFAGVC